MRLFAGLVAILSAPQQAMACAEPITPAGQKAEQERQEQYLERESDKTVVGDFRADLGGRREDGGLPGVIEVMRGKQIQRYRVTIRDVINCGFPYYFLKDGDHGVFYLKRDDYPDADDREDGYIDNYSYVHFRLISRLQD